MIKITIEDNKNGEKTVYECASYIFGAVSNSCETETITDINADDRDVSYLSDLIKREIRL